MDGAIKNLAHEVGDSALQGLFQGMIGHTMCCMGTSVARFAGRQVMWDLNLGFRCAPPQALCFHPLRGLRQLFQKTSPILAKILKENNSNRGIQNVD